MLPVITSFLLINLVLFIEVVAALYNLNGHETGLNFLNDYYRRSVHGEAQNQNSSSSNKQTSTTPAENDKAKFV